MIEEIQTPQSDSSAPSGRLHLLVRPPPPAARWAEDVKRIRAAMNRLGFDASNEDISAAYDEYSEEEMCCGWVSMDIWSNDEGAAKAALRYLVEPNDKIHP
jgi:hypothetical protein